MASWLDDNLTLTLTLMTGRSSDGSLMARYIQLPAWCVRITRQEGYTDVLPFTAVTAADARQIAAALDEQLAEAVDKAEAALAEIDAERAAGRAAAAQEASARIGRLRERLADMTGVAVEDLRVPAGSAPRPGPLPDRDELHVSASLDLVRSSKSVDPGDLPGWVAHLYTGKGAHRAVAVSPQVCARVAELIDNAIARNVAVSRVCAANDDLQLALRDEISRAQAAIDAA